MSVVVSPIDGLFGVNERSSLDVLVLSGNMNVSEKSLVLLVGPVNEVVDSNSGGGVVLHVVLEDVHEVLLEELVSGFILFLGKVLLSVLGKELLEFELEFSHSLE